MRPIGKDEAIERFRAKITRAEELKSERSGSPEFERWRRDTEVLVEYVFGTGSRHVKDFTEVSYSLGFYVSGMPDSAFQKAHQRGLESAKQVLASFIEEIDQYWEQMTDATPPPDPPLRRLEVLCDRFHLVARRLRSRHSDRPTLDVEDEYDVQDLLHALLTIDFEDIRPEEWTPSHAGSSSRVDFLLRDHGIVVEVKKTRRGLTDKRIGEELIVDRARYQSHPDCRLLFCFIYDPDGLIGNPRGLESDLNNYDSGLPIRVIIAPRG